MAARALLLLLLSAGCALGSLTARRLPLMQRTQRVVSSPVCCAREEDDAWRSVRPSELSAELSRFNTRGARLRTSAPVRYALSALDDGRRSIYATQRFFVELATALPTNRIMLALIAAAYALQSALGKAMLLAGARMNEYILYGGQWHRLVTPMWLHGSVMHLLSNAYSLFYLGPSAERVFGSEGFLLIFLLSGIGGNLLGLRFGALRGMSVGASGAVFGLMGGLVGYALKNYGTPTADYTLSSLSRILLINLFIGLSPRSGIDNLGHVGGFLSGALVGFALAPDERPGSRWERGRLGDAVLRVATIAILAIVALSTRDFARLTMKLRSFVR